ncbi:MAG: hypothetical protein OEV78_11955 [Spirochaetia bacterium]|nr:hypothetical protein [Spirochaetia bacterium]
MNIMSLCKNFDLREFIDLGIFEVIGKEISSMSNALNGYHVIISDDAGIINSFRTKFSREALFLIPVVALLKQESSYSVMHKCIQSGAAALVIKI